MTLPDLASCFGDGALYRHEKERAELVRHILESPGEPWPTAGKAGASHWRFSDSSDDVYGTPWLDATLGGEGAAEGAKAATDEILSHARRFLRVE